MICSRMLRALLHSGKFRQEHVVLAAFLVFFVLFGVFANGFLTVSNIVVLVRNVSILGVLGLGMAIVVIGRGIDLSMISVMAVSGAWAVERITAGAGEWVAVALALVFAGLVGVLNGVVIAYGEISPLLATLASGILVYGFGRAFLVHLALV